MKIRINKNCLVELFLIGINVFLIPLTLFRRREKTNILIITLFFSVLAYYFIPPVEYDLYRRYIFYNEFKHFNLSGSKDIFLIGATYIGNKLGFRANFLAFISAFIFYYYLVKIGMKTLERKKISDMKYRLYLLIYILSMPLILYTGIRFPTGLILFMYGLYSYFYINKKRSYFYMILAGLSHFSFWILIGLFMIYDLFLKKIKSSNFWFFLTIVSLILGLNIESIIIFITLIINEVNKIFGREFFDVSAYILGEWGLDRMKNFSLLSKVIFNTRLILIEMLFFFNAFICLKRKVLKLDETFTLYITSICLLMTKIQTPFERYSKIPILFILIINTEKSFLEKRINKTNVVMFSLIILIFFNFSYELKLNYIAYIESYKEIWKISGLKMIIENIF